MSIDIIRKHYIEANKSLYEISKILNIPLSRVRFVAHESKLITHHLANFCTKNKGKKILIFDLETTGLPQTKGFNRFYKYDRNEYYDSSRIIQLSYCVHELGKTLDAELEIYNFYRYPDEDIVISDDAFRIHGISQDKLIQDGIKFTDIIHSGLINALNECDYIMSHNINFDFNILLNELFRIDYNIPKNWHTKLVCSCKLTDYTKLSTLYEIVVGKHDTDLNYHNASVDVLVLSRILSHL